MTNMIRRFLEMAVSQVHGPVGWFIMGSILSISMTLKLFEFDSREGTIACDGAKSIMIKDAIYCKKAEEESEE